MPYLVTGAQGCIGSWVVRNLLRDRKDVVVFDLEREPRRLNQILAPDEIERITFVQGDICDLRAVRRVFDEHAISRVINLAALQVPACQADPPRGALVNVVGTLNVFEAAAERRGRVDAVIYASSVAVAGPPEDYGELPFSETSHVRPGNHYGVFKQCNEGNARVYFETRQLSSIGLRPWAVYGVGRDFGLTSDPTKAIKAAVVGHPFQIQFGGRIDMQYVDDVARTFIRCADAHLEGARVYNLRGDVVAVGEIIETIERVVPGSKSLISFRGSQLPIVPDCDDSALRSDIGQIPRTSLLSGVQQTVDIFRQLEREDRLSTQELQPARV